MPIIRINWYQKMFLYYLLILLLFVVRVRILAKEDCNGPEVFLKIPFLDYSTVFRARRRRATNSYAGHECHVCEIAPVHIVMRNMEKTNQARVNFFFYSFKTFKYHYIELHNSLVYKLISPDIILNKKKSNGGQKSSLVISIKFS